MENKFALFTVIDCNKFSSASRRTEFVKAFAEVWCLISWVHWRKINFDDREVFLESKLRMTDRSNRIQMAIIYFLW